jgi:beta-glucoside operon transcriptional antiterminator
MEVIKKLNNNVAVCRDSAGQELIAFGKGIGFPKIPYELSDLGLISETFYQINPSHYGLFSEISPEIFKLSSAIVNKAKESLEKNFNPNLMVSLADHIDFAIKRLKKYKSMKLLFAYDVEQMYPAETEIGRFAVEKIAKDLGEHLPDSEITSIALHFVNATEGSSTYIQKYNYDAIITMITKTIEDYFSVTLDKKSFSYNRFVSHIRYLLQRAEKGEQFIEEEGLYDVLRVKYPKIFVCTQQITHDFESLFKTKISDNEKVYLMIHIQRILQNNI